MAHPTRHGRRLILWAALTAAVVVVVRWRGRRIAEAESVLGIGPHRPPGVGPEAPTHLEPAGGRGLAPRPAASK